jgi:hypothetical protein
LHAEAVKAKKRFQYAIAVSALGYLKEKDKVVKIVTFIKTLPDKQYS